MRTIYTVYYLTLFIIVVSNASSKHLTSNWHCGDECTPTNTTKATQCAYINTCCTDTLDGSLIDYLAMQYCTLNTVQPLGVILLSILVFYAFLILGSIADDFFAPTMSELADFLGVSHELAGVTFVALGNGAPDISSSIAAITMGGDAIKLGLGALLGAAVFDTIAVSGVIALVVTNPQVARRPFLRDCFFLFVAASCVLFITVDGKVSVKEAIGMVVIYILYVTTVLLGELHKKMTQSKPNTSAGSRRETVVNLLGVFSDNSMFDVYADNQPLNKWVQLAEEDTQERHTGNVLGIPRHTRSVVTSTSRRRSSIKHLAASLRSEEDHNEDKVWWKVWLDYVIRGPVLLVLMLCKITIPLTDEDNWNDWISVASCILAPLWIEFAFARRTMSLFVGPLPVVVIVILVGVMLSVFTLWRLRLKYVQRELQTNLLDVNDDVCVGLGSSIQSQSDGRKNEDKLKQKAVMKLFFLLLSFVSAVAWISVVANELVNLLTTLGVISTIDLALLGLTVLAWGNSIGDMIADVSVSKRGYAKMGISAAISGPTLNVLIGVGLGTTITTASSSNAIMDMPNTDNILVCCIAVMTGIAIYALWTGINRWTLHKSFGYFCFVYYFAFIIINILVYRRM